MSLAAVLSAMREIILDAPPIPASYEERVIMYKQSFPNLNAAELEDLSKIAPEKFKIYTSSIFVGEKNIITNNFPMTVKTLEHNWAAECDGKFNLVSIVKDLHKSRPWRSTASTALGRNFVEYLKEKFTAIHNAAPYLVELAEMEHLIRKIRKQRDTPCESAFGCDSALIAELTVEQVMDLQYALPSSAVLRGFDYDLVGARAEFLNARMKVLPKVAKRRIYAALSRDADGIPRWRELDKKLFEYLEAQERDKPLPMEPLAEVIVSCGEGGPDEQEMFVAFIKQLTELMRSGVISVPVVSLPKVSLPNVSPPKVQ